MRTFEITYTLQQFVWTSGGWLFIESYGRPFIRCSGCCSWETIDPNSGSKTPGGSLSERPGFFVPNLRPAVCQNLRPHKILMEQVWLQRRITDTSGRKSLSCLADMGHLSLVSLLTWSIASRDFWLCYRDFELRQQEHDAAENWTFQNGPAKHSKSYSVRKQGDLANIISKVHLVDHFWNFLLQHISSRGTLRQSEFWPWLSCAAAPFRRFQVKIVWRIYEAPWWILVVESKQNYVNIFFALWLVICRLRQSM